MLTFEETIAFDNFTVDAVVSLTRRKLMATHTPKKHISKYIIQNSGIRLYSNTPHK